MTYHMPNIGLSSGWGMPFPIPANGRSVTASTSAKNHVEAIVREYLSPKLAGCSFAAISGLKDLPADEFRQMPLAGTMFEVAHGALLESGTRVGQTLGDLCDAVGMSQWTVGQISVSGAMNGKVTSAEMAQRFRMLAKPN